MYSRQINNLFSLKTNEVDIWAFPEADYAFLSMMTKLYRNLVWITDDLKMDHPTFKFVITFNPHIVTIGRIKYMFFITWTQYISL